LFGENVNIYVHKHGSDSLFREQGLEPVSIGDNCWIGSNTVILKGVKIGLGVVVGAGTILSKNVPDNSIMYQKRELTVQIQNDSCKG